MKQPKPFFEVPIPKNKKEKHFLFLMSLLITLIIVAIVLIKFRVGITGGSLIIWISILALLYVLITKYNNRKK